MTFAELYACLYASDEDKQAAVEELQTMSNEEWSDWLRYRNRRQGKGEY